MPQVLPPIAWKAELDPKVAEAKQSRLGAAVAVALRCKLPLVGSAIVGITVLGFGAAAVAVPTPVGLGTADSAAVLGGSGASNTGVSTITGNVSSSPTPAQPGFAACPAAADCVAYVPTTPLTGQHQADGVAAQQKLDATAAYVQAVGLAPTAGATVAQLNGLDLVGGVYDVGGNGGGAANLANNGVFTLNAANDPNSSWVFRTQSLTINTGSNVVFSNAAGLDQEALACRVYWTVAASANILGGAGTQFVGTVLAQTSITVGDSVTVHGRLLAGTVSSTGGNVSLIHDTINPGGCGVVIVPAGSGGGSSGGGTVATPGGSGGGTVATPGGSGGGSTATSFVAPPATPVAAPPTGLAG